ncbi:unnamed protein product [Brassicogethes aeneus]|uniref:Kinesin motor domain-containing protein n=1 Tax=Brassicogethes aeneus TaxID=1431903 RepID=A0A9P0ANS0_BRAAE|nr:unnamed protein product [Brassicogethes aeneus]
MSKKNNFVNVSIRIKPALNKNLSKSSCLHVLKDNLPVLIVSDRPQTYVFDNIFTEDANQEIIYNNTVKPLIQHVKNGYNCTIFTYGQTGTGKSYTMGTFSQPNRDENEGLIPRTLASLFEEENECEISVSFIEIYNEKVYDLLTNNKSPLIVKGFKVCNFNNQRVFTPQEAMHFLNMGNTNRHTGETKQNTKSSRSHAIFTIHCNSFNGINAKLNLVDLAGCESVKKTGTQGNSFFEGVNINKGLLSIGQVMSALSLDASYIPYRQSVLTTILQDSLNKRNYVSLISCVSSLPEDVNETVQTLEFAYRVKKIKSKPRSNEPFLLNKNEISFSKSYTPFKRPYMTSNSLVSTKKNRFCASLGTISDQYKNSTIESPKSVSSLSTSPIICYPSQQSFSPVIKKYINAMESSIITKLGSVIEKSLLKPRRSSRKSIKIIEKENTPSPKYSWNQIQSEVTKLVKTEIQQFSVQSIRATSSPIINETTLKRVLSYDSPDLNKDMVESKEVNYNEFKIPSIPLKKKKYNEISMNPRRSLRLSLKDCSNTIDSFVETSSKSPVKKNRRSIRLTEKQEKTQIFINENSKINIINISNTSKTPRTKSKLKRKTCSPLTAHNKHVLNILNKGSLKQLEGLHSVGIKTAQQILLYRNLKGSFFKIEDLNQIPGWSEKKVKNFMVQNFII